MIRVELPALLRNIARVNSEIQVEVSGDVTIEAVLDALEQRFPTLQGTIRDHVTKKRRAFVRFFACQQDFSLEPQSVRLPQEVAEGKEPLMVVGAIAGG
jgi:molybdopterin converting factor small subunit